MSSLQDVSRRWGDEKAGINLTKTFSDLPKPVFLVDDKDHNYEDGRLRVMKVRTQAEGTQLVCMMCYWCNQQIAYACNRNCERISSAVLDDAHVLPCLKYG